MSENESEEEHLASLGAWANPGHPVADWHSKSAAYAEGFRRGHAAGFSRSPAVQVAVSALLDAAAAIEPLSGAPLASGATRAEIAKYLRARAEIAKYLCARAMQVDEKQWLERVNDALFTYDHNPNFGVRQVAAALRSPVGDES